MDAVQSWRASSPSALKWRLQADICFVIGLCLSEMGRYSEALSFFEMDAKIGHYAGQNEEA
ncbi:unnamed protein product [Protopolystoma xenopodis]|uniref:Uncharacterized protein n=1 Tax=Protopolystoma xenopodis TaxID=117903 RepID=A0A448WCU8_9PLAT|nr:unnamed protein product [Protopolystoma xenopodis]